MTKIRLDAPIYGESLSWHSTEPKGKISTWLPKSLKTQKDLALAYSPGVAAPCMKIHEDKESAYEYTSKGNLVAIISNGTAVLGLGNIGSLASKPVMEGKAVLMKRFAGVDAVDLLVDTEDPEEMVNIISKVAGTWGGINLEDIKAPECFIVETKLKEMLDIPVFHDDQHGTAIVTLAGMINALKLTGRRLEDVRIVVNGAGAAAIACSELLRKRGVLRENLIMCDTKGVIYEGRTDGMNQWKDRFAIPTDKRTLAEAVAGADVFIGLSVKGALTAEMVKSMASQPIIFAMANPDPEISPEEVALIRGDAIVATGRSDYPNQVNNVMGFPYIFRAALDVRATQINDAMKIAAAHAIAEIARSEENLPKELHEAYPNIDEKQLRFGPGYIVPLPFDPRLRIRVSEAVARAAIETGVARRPIADWDLYREGLEDKAGL